MSEKKNHKIVLEDYSFTNKVIKVEMEQKDTIQGIVGAIKTTLGLKSEKLQIFFGLKKSKSFEVLTKKNLSKLWDMTEEGDVVLQIRRKINLTGLRRIKDDVSDSEVDLPVSILKVDNVSAEETKSRLNRVALEFLDEKLRIIINKKIHGYEITRSDNYYLSKFIKTIQEKLKELKYYEI